MKHVLLTIAIVVHGFLIAQTTKTIKTKPDKATVYLQGAHLYYTENISLKVGINEFIFEGISPYIRQTSIQAGTKSGIVMDMKYDASYTETTPDPTATKKYAHELELVLDSLEDLSYKERDISNKMKVLATEKELLLNNRIMKGDLIKDSLPLLKDGMAFLKEKLNAIYAEELKYERAKNELNKTRTHLNTRQRTLQLLQNGQGNKNNGNAERVHKILITVYSETVTNTQLNFNYFINNASWVPAYDLQASSSSSSLKINYFAQVSQSSGLDWKNMPLTLSTSTPNLNNTKPVLSPWYLSFRAFRQNQSHLSNAAVPLQRETLQLKDRSFNGADEEVKSLLDYINVTENLLRTEYEIKLNYTINSDGKGHKVMINDKSVPMGLQFAAIPKLSPDAYLMARITQWEEMNIIPGNARVYFDGTFVGDMYLNTYTTDDTLKVNLGRDRSFVSSRKKIKEESKKQFIGGDKIETRTIELIVRNTKNQEIEVEVEDQIPVVSGTKEIKVTLKDSDNADLNEATGSLKWDLKLKPKEAKKLRFTYEIRYPKDKKVAGL